MDISKRFYIPAMSKNTPKAFGIEQDFQDGYLGFTVQASYSVYTSNWDTGCTVSLYNSSGVKVLDNLGPGSYYTYNKDNPIPCRYELIKKMLMELDGIYTGMGFS